MALVRPPAKLPAEQTAIKTTLGALVRAHTSGEFSLWKHNRDVDNARAAIIARHYRANGFNAGPQPLIIAVDLRGAGYLIDGQHRLTAGRLMGAEADQVKVLVVYHPCDDEAAIRECFRSINMATPVPSRFFDDGMKFFTAETTEAIIRRWPGLLSDAPKPNRPRFSRDSLAAQLGCERCRRALMSGLLTTKTFMAALDVVCLDIERQYAQGPAEAADRHSTKKAPTVTLYAQQHRFYAGVSFTWGDMVAGRILADAEVAERFDEVAVAAALAPALAPAVAPAVAPAPAPTAAPAPVRTPAPVSAARRAAAPP